MKTSKRPTLPTYSPVLGSEPQKRRLTCCTLKWRQKQLLVGVEQKIKQAYLPAVDCKRSLVECLKHSPVRLVRIDPDLGEASLQFWADACEQANKAIFLRLPAAQKIPKQGIIQPWWLQQLIDRITAAVLLLVLSPVILIISCLMQTQSPEPIFFRQWCVGKRGKLFRLIKFRTVFVDTQVFEPEMVGEQQILQKRPCKPWIVALGHWMRNSNIDELPQLFNVLRGELSLVGRPAYNLYDAVRISPEKRWQMNALPGIIESWQAEQT